MKNFIDIKEHSKSELISLLDNALQNKRSRTTTQNNLNGKNLVLLEIIVLLTQVQIHFLPIFPEPRVLCRGHHPVSVVQ